MTGVGLVSPLATGAAPTWDAIVAGRSGIGPITRFDTEAFTAKMPPLNERLHIWRPLVEDEEAGAKAGLAHIRDRWAEATSITL